MVYPPPFHWLYRAKMMWWSLIQTEPIKTSSFIKRLCYKPRAFKARVGHTRWATHFSFSQCSFRTSRHSGSSKIARRAQQSYSLMSPQLHANSTAESCGWYVFYTDYVFMDKTGHSNIWNTWNDAHKVRVGCRTLRNCLNCCFGFRLIKAMQPYLR